MPFYFDLFSRGFASDTAARKFVVAKRKGLGGRAVSTPPLLLMNAKGDVVGQAGAYVSSDKVLEALLATLKKHPQYNQLSDAEKKIIDPIKKAQLYIDLVQYDKARAILMQEKSEQAAYLSARLARFAKDWKRMNEHLAKVKSKSLADDVRMERAYLLWHQKQFAKLRDHLKAFPKTSKHYTAARYYEGLAYHHLGEKEKALQVWESTITACSQDPWIYRADWAYTNVKDGKKGFFSTSGPRTSLLNRIGYMGKPNPDLQKR